MNGGTLENESCTCDCPSIYSGDMCESKLVGILCFNKSYICENILLHTVCIYTKHTYVCMYMCS